jgi:hypothetical protein
MSDAHGGAYKEVKSEFYIEDICLLVCDAV